MRAARWSSCANSWRACRCKWPWQLKACSEHLPSPKQVMVADSSLHRAVQAVLATVHVRSVGPMQVMVCWCVDPSQATDKWGGPSSRTTPEGLISYITACIPLKLDNCLMQVMQLLPRLTSAAQQSVKLAVALAFNHTAVPGMPFHQQHCGCSRYCECPSNAATSYRLKPQCTAAAPSRSIHTVLPALIARCREK